MLFAAYPDQCHFFPNIQQRKLRGMKQMHTTANQPSHADKAEQQTGADDDPNERFMAQLSEQRSEQRHQTRPGEGAQRDINPAQ